MLQDNREGVTPIQPTHPSTVEEEEEQQTKFSGEHGNHHVSLLLNGGILEMIS